MPQTHSAAAMRIIDKLAGQPPQTITELMNALQVTRTAITDQLDELAKQGVVQRVSEPRDSRGRPKFRYSLAPKSHSRIFPGNQGSVIYAIWRGIWEIGGKELQMEVVEHAVELLRKFFEDKIKGKTPLERFLEVMTVTAVDGRIRVQQNPDGSCDVWRYICELDCLEDTNSRLCDLHVVFIEKVTGGKVIHVESRHEGAPCCRFRLLPFEPGS